MLKQGLLSEVKKLLEDGHTKELKPMQSIGYKEVIE